MSSAEGTTDDIVLMGLTLRNGVVTTDYSKSREGYGGGVAGGTLINCVITNCMADIAGGGAYMATLDRCKIVGNMASSGGGAEESALTNCILAGNSATTFLSYLSEKGCGGGASYSTLTQCLLDGNTAQYYGGGAYRSTLRQCTVAKNAANYGGGVSTGIKLANSIVWGNTGLDGITQNNYTLDWNSAVTYSCLSPLPSSSYGPGNIGTNPLFVDPANGDYHLESSSPCLDTGDILNFTWDVTEDLDGHPRFQNGRIDMGAYEGSAIGMVNPVSQMYVDAGHGHDSNNGLSWATAKQTIQSAIDLVDPSGVILVTNGVYAPIYSPCKPIRTQRLTGSRRTIITGDPVIRYLLLPALGRCLRMVAAILR